jgi:hypothetical protein
VSEHNSPIVVVLIQNRAVCYEISRISENTPILLGEDVICYVCKGGAKETKRDPKMLTLTMVILI